MKKLCLSISIIISTICRHNSLLHYQIVYFSNIAIVKVVTLCFIFVLIFKLVHDLFSLFLTDCYHSSKFYDINCCRSFMIKKERQLLLHMAIIGRAIFLERAIKKRSKELLTKESRNNREK